MAKRTKLQELKHEFNKNILGTEGYDEQDRQQELDKARNKSVAKLEKEAQGKGDKADIAKQALAGKTEVASKQVIDATTGEKKPITETTANTANTTPAKTEKPKTDTPAKKKDDDYTWAEVLEMNGGDMEKTKQWIIDHDYTIGKNTEEAIGGKEKAQELREAQNARREAQAKQKAAERETQENINIDQAKNDLVSGTEGEINAKADVLQEQIDEKGNERAKKFSDRVKEFTEGVNDHYIEGLPKGIWKQYKSGEYGYSKEQAQNELDKLHEGEITWSKKRRDYLRLLI